MLGYSAWKHPAAPGVAWDIDSCQSLSRLDLDCSFGADVEDVESGWADSVVFWLNAVLTMRTHAADPSQPIALRSVGVLQHPEALRRVSAGVVAISAVKSSDDLGVTIILPGVTRAQFLRDRDRTPEQTRVSIQDPVFGPLNQEASRYGFIGRMGRGGETVRVTDGAKA